MSWEPGLQEGKLKDSREIYKELENLPEELSEEEAIYYLIKFLKESPTFATQLICGVRLYPFQHIMIKGMFNTDYFLGVLSRGLSKTYSSGIFAALYAIFNPGIQIGVLSKTFRQSKGILQKILDISKKPEAQILADAISKFTPSSDIWSIEIGQSKIVALPLGDGSRIRGFRFQCIIIDEFLLMPEKIYKEVILPFLGVAPNPTEREDLRLAEDDLVARGVMTDAERYKWPNNKIISLSSASYQFEYLYTLYKSYCQSILEGKVDKESDENKIDGATRSIVQLSYLSAPADMFDKSAMEQSRKEMSQAQMDREYGSIFTSDSSGYFRISKMEEVSLKNDSTPCVEIKGNPMARYVLSFDPSWSKSEASDDFCMSVFLLDEEHSFSTLVHCYAMPGVALKSHIDYFIYLLENFNIVFIVGDYNGGVSFIESFNESETVRSKKLQIENINGPDFNDAEKFWDDVKLFKKEYNLAARKICYLKYPTSNWIRSANELLSGNIENKKIWFANDARNIPSVYNDAINSPLEIGHLKFLKDGDLDTKEEGDIKISKRTDLIENVYDMILLTKVECALIEIRTSANGIQSFDLTAQARLSSGPNRTRKDNYSALLLGNWGVRIFNEAETFKEDNVNSTFLPFFV